MSFGGLVEMSVPSHASCPVTVNTLYAILPYGFSFGRSNRRGVSWIHIFAGVYSHYIPVLSPQMNFINSFQGQDFQLEIHLPNPDTTILRHAKLYVCPELRRLVAGQDKAIKQRLDQCSDVASFLVDLKDLLVGTRTRFDLAFPSGRKPRTPWHVGLIYPWFFSQERTLPATTTPSAAKPTALPSPDYYTTLLSELESIGWHRVHDIDPSLAEFSIHITDTSRRTHKLHVRLPATYPFSAPAITADLPVAAAGAEGKGKRLAALVEHFTGEVKRYADLWDCLDDLDGQTWRLEPEKPTRAEAWRRLALGGLQPLLSPARPRPDGSTCGPYDPPLRPRAAYCAPSRSHGA
ncbi:WD-repeat region-domain-containing protein [Jimgerdemannia flammicorona]|uniref:WD-repeat region-domain-containing protein n=1 Tax=Jimgerdemannia flammicorona TaxID=994334 RepID=A0A433DI79_9FUNG|nr:WD-repeat region-domain-containing protein [Jimgerdemannia flammicorona]